MVQFRPREVQSLPRAELGALREADEARITELFEILARSDLHLVVRSRGNRVGSVVVGTLELRVAPEISPATLLAMLLFASGVPLEKFLKRGAISVDVDDHPDRDVLQLLAYLMAAASRAILGRHVVQQYERVEDRLTILRGRVQWTKDFGPSRVGRSCQYFEKRTDNRLNQLVLAGLDVARALAREPVVAREVQTQHFIWRDLATFRVFDGAAFDNALRSLDRLSEHYRDGLSIARLLIRGQGPEALFNGAGAPIQAMWFDVPSIFESLVARAVGEYLAAVGHAVVRVQDVRDRLLVDADGKPYRTVRPDIVIYGSDVPVMVIDAKFKARYVERRGDGDPRGLVESADIYQLYFYGERLGHWHGLETAVPTFIVAPLVDRKAGVARARRRVVRWQDRSGTPGCVVTVLPLDLQEFLGLVRSGYSTVDALSNTAPELASHLATATAHLSI